MNLNHFGWGNGYLLNIYERKENGQNSFTRIAKNQDDLLEQIGVKNGSKKVGVCVIRVSQEDGSMTCDKPVNVR